MTTAAVYEVRPGSIVVVSDWDEADQTQEDVVEAIAKAVSHRDFVVLFVSEDQAARVFGPEDLVEALRVATA